MSRRRGLPHRGAVGLLTATVVAPLLYVPGVYFPYVTTRALWFRGLVELALLLFLWLLLTRGAGSGSDGERHDLRDPVVWALAGFAAWAGLSAFLGAAPETSLFGDLQRMWGAIHWLHLLLFYVLLRCLFREEDWHRLFRASLLVAVAVCGYALLRWYGATETLGAFGAVHPTPIGTLGNHGYLSVYALLHAILAGVLWAREGPSPAWRRALYAAAGGLATFTFLVAFSRAVLLGAAAGGVIVLAARRGRIRNRLLALDPLQIAGGALAAGLLLWGGWHLLTEIAPPTRRLAVLEWGVRGPAWKAAALGFLENPLTGVGLENFTVLFERHLSVESGVAAHVFLDRAHNAYLGAAAETGLPGFLLYLAIGAGVGWTLWRGWRGGRVAGLEASALNLLLVSYAVFLFFWFEDHNTTFLVLAVAAYLRHRTAGCPLLALGPESGRPRTRRRWHRVAPWPRRATGLVLMVAGAAALWQLSRVWVAARETELALSADSLPEKVERFERARSFGIPQDREVAYAYVDEVVRYRHSPDWVKAREERLRALERGIAGAGEAISAAVAERPGDARLWKQHGLLALTAYRLTGRRELHEQAVRSLEVAVERSPGRLPYRHLLAEAQLTGGDVDGARRTVQQVLDLKTRSLESYYVLSRIHLQAGEPDAAARELYRSCRMGRSVQNTPYLSKVARRLADDGRPDQAAELYRECFAAKYLPALRSRTSSVEAVPGAEPIYLPAGVIPEGLFPNDDDPSLVTGIRTYAIEPEDLGYLLRWSPLYLRAGAPEEATLAARLVINGLRPGNTTYVVLPYLTRFISDIQAGRLERWEGRESLLPEGARLEVIRGQPGDWNRESSEP